MGQKASRPCPSKPGQAPWLVFDHGEEASQTFYSVAQGRACFANIPEMQSSTYWLTPQGWVLAYDPNPPPSHRYFLFHPSTAKKVALPPLEQELPGNAICTLSSSPAEPECTVLCADLETQQIFVCNPGGDKWFSYDTEALIEEVEGQEQKEEVDGQVEEIEEEEEEIWENNNLCSNIVSCKGKFYVQTQGCKLAVIDTCHQPPQIGILELIDPEWPIGVVASRRCLVESCGQLFCVVFCNATTYPYSEKTVHICVYKRDPVSRGWEAVDSVGGRAFFLVPSYYGYYGFGASCSASELGIKGDCIYFARVDDGRLHVFDMEEGTLQVLEPCSELGDNWSAPLWIMPAL